MRGSATRWLLALPMLLVLLAACADKRTTTSSGTVGEYKVGKPYQIDGVWYYPREDWEYRETGIASWYGPGFHGKRTANGEVYDQNALTAAHPTLPMPVVVQVTNLENGRSIKVRINDRGPFANGRIIDLSRRSAQLLDMERNGTAKVLVEILPNESLQLASQARARTPITDDPDVPAAAPVETVQAKPLGGTGLAPQPAPAPTPVPVPLPAPSTASTAPVPLPAETVVQKNVQPTDIWIQAGSFSNPANAEALKHKLGHLGQVLVTAARVGSQNFYRVRVGPLASVAAADRVLNELIRSGYTDSHIVVD